MEVNPINLIDRDTLTTVGLVVPLSLLPACVEVNTTTRVFRQALYHWMRYVATRKPCAFFGIGC
jgi:hypothetical protein